MAFRKSLAVGAIAVVGGLGPAAPPAAAGEWFRNVAVETGLDFRHQDGRSGRKHYVETTASGGGWLDFDGDGDLDLYLVNGAATPGSRLLTTPRNALYENRGDRFVDVAAAAGVDDDGFGMGLCAGDVDADGRLDFLVTNFGADRLYHNLGPDAGGRVRFEEIGRAAGIAEDRWSVACAFGDLDGDGDLDLYVTHYVDFAYGRGPECGDPGTGARLYCRPDDFDGVADSLFLHQGVRDGRVSFREDGAARGIAQGVSEKGMGVILSDLDGDGDLDAYVANDGALNRLYVNDGKGVFEDRALTSGAGLSAVGIAEAGMGVDAGDVDGDGELDVILSHFAMETNTLYRNLGGLQFEDLTGPLGLGPISYKRVGWGIQLFDFDNDGDLDLAVANGHMQEGVEKLEPGLSYRQPNQLLENLRGGAAGVRFRDVSRQAGEDFAVAEVSRGLAVGDWNDDGRLDLLVTNTNAGVDLLENRFESPNRWLGLVLEGPPANPFAIGARVELEAGGRRQIREVRSGGGFQSQSDLRLHFGLGEDGGLGAARQPVEVEIRWPDGHRQRERTAELDRYWTIRYRGR